MDLIVNATRGRSLERKAWGRVFNDGLWDIYVGALFANVVLYMTAGELGWSYGDTAVPPIIVLILAAGLQRFAKQRITEPRIGHFKIERRRLSGKRLGLFLTLIVTLMLVVFTILAGSGAFPD